MQIMQLAVRTKSGLCLDASFEVQGRDRAPQVWSTHTRRAMLGSTVQFTVSSIGVVTVRFEKCNGEINGEDDQ